MKHGLQSLLAIAVAGMAAQSAEVIQPIAPTKRTPGASPYAIRRQPTAPALDIAKQKRKAKIAKASRRRNRKA